MNNIYIRLANAIKCNPKILLKYSLFFKDDMKVRLSEKDMKNKDYVHLYIKHQLDNNEYYGNNLDALWDVLMSYSSKIEIRLIDKESLIANLEDYGYALIDVFEDASKENKNVIFEIHNTREEKL